MMQQRLRDFATPRRLALAGGLLAAGALVFVFRKHIPFAEIRTWIESLDSGALVLALVVLPLFAFPSMPLHLVAGVRFGVWGAMSIILLAVLIQHLFAYVAVWIAPRFFEERLARMRARIPTAAHTPATIFTSLVPGVPYVATLYVLPLIGVPLITYLAISAPLHAVRSIVTVAFGDFSDRLTPARIAYLVIYGLLISGTSAWLFRRLRRQLHNRPATNADQENAERSQAEM